MTFFYGYRQDKLNWNIAGSNNVPDIISELQWNKLDIIEFEGRTKMSLSDKVIVDFQGSYGLIMDGSNQDSDYAGNDRKLEYSRSNNDAGDGSVWDLNLALGYKIYDSYDTVQSEEKRTALTFLGGYSINKQNLQIQNGMQTLSRPDLYSDVAFLGVIENLESRYNAQWQGPWIGMNLEMPSLKWKSKLRYEYHFETEYSAEAHWNLRDLDFQHESNSGEGHVVEFGVNYLLSNSWNIDVLAKYSRFNVEDGRDITSSTRQNLNRVNWESMAFKVGFSYSF